MCIFTSHFSFEVVPKCRPKIILMTKSKIETDFLASLKFETSTKKYWDKFVQLFGKEGACGNCWCMYYQLKKSDFQEGKIDEGNKNAMKELHK